MATPMSVPMPVLTPKPLQLAMSLPAYYSNRFGDEPQTKPDSPSHCETVCWVVRYEAIEFDDRFQAVRVVTINTCGSERGDMDPGDFVIDVDDDDPDLAVVIARPNERIDEWTVTGGDGNERTVAADNPDYDPDEPVVVVAFVESGLEANWSNWSDADPDALADGAAEHDVRRYAFPESRLRTCSGAEVVRYHPQTAVDVEALQTRLEDANWTVSTTADGLIVEKAGDEYHIHPSGEVTGDGSLLSPLSNMVGQYVDGE